MAANEAPRRESSPLSRPFRACLSVMLVAELAVLMAAGVCQLASPGGLVEWQTLLVLSLYLLATVFSAIAASGKSQAKRTTLRAIVTANAVALLLTWLCRRLVHPYAILGFIPRALEVPTLVCLGAVSVVLAGLVGWVFTYPRASGRTRHAVLLIAAGIVIGATAILLAVLLGGAQKLTPRVAAELAAIRAEVEARELEPGKDYAHLGTEERVRRQLADMVSVDQYLRSKIDLPKDRDFGLLEGLAFMSGMGALGKDYDRLHATELRRLLADAGGWPTISKFGEKADTDAWLIVQHADHDPAFQSEVLVILEGLVATRETSPQNYCYLHDRVAVAAGRPQRYGTQGECTDDGAWTHYPLEDASRIDELRNSMGLSSLAAYVSHMNTLCH